MTSGFPRSLRTNPESGSGLWVRIGSENPVAAYELLFRSSRTAQFADFDEVGQAAMRVMVNTFASLGMEAVLGRSLGFFNVTGEVFLSELVEVLPRERVVLEILEDVEATEEIQRRCQELTAAGFAIALDDWIVDAPRECLLPWASVVKVDLPAVPEKDLRKLVRTLRRSNVRLLAEKVETAEQFETCHKLGLNLLRLVNTVGMAAPVRLETIEDAIRSIGLQQLGRWVAILIYVDGDQSDLPNPLLTTAAHRGRLMELIVSAAEANPARAVEAERAFLVGMLSLMDALLGRPIEALVRELHLGSEISRALTHHEGDLGRLLEMAQSIERGEVDKFEPELHERDLYLETLQQLENAAYAWVHGLLQVPTG